MIEQIKNLQYFLKIGKIHFFFLIIKIDKSMQFIGNVFNMQYYL